MKEDEWPFVYIYCTKVIGLCVIKMAVTRVEFGYMGYFWPYCWSHLANISPESFPFRVSSLTDDVNVMDSGISSVLRIGRQLINKTLHSAIGTAGVMLGEVCTKEREREEKRITACNMSFFFTSPSILCNFFFLERRNEGGGNQLNLVDGKDEFYALPHSFFSLHSRA